MTPIFDGGSFVGHDLESGFHYSVEDLLGDFDRYGATRGLVGSYRCIYQDLREGNAEAARWGARFPDRIVPLGILHPAYYGEDPEALLKWLKQDLGFRVVGLFGFPAYFQVEWDSAIVRKIGQIASGLSLALQAGIRTEADLSGVQRSWGDLDTPVMIRWMAGHRYRTLASEVAVAGLSRNFLFDTANLSSSGALEYLAGQVGAGRLFFASNSPHHIPACPHAILRDAHLEPSQKAQVGSGTICRALRLEPPVPSLVSASGESDWQALCALPKVDIHWHPDHWNMGEPRLSEGDQMATFDRYGYERVVMFSIMALNYDLEQGNSLTETWFQKDPRAFGMIVVNPFQQDLSLEQIERYADHPRFVGVKTIQDVFGLGLDAPLYEPLLRKAVEKRLPVLAHMPGMEGAAARHPEITFIAAHANWGRARRFFGMPNVCFDFSTGHALRHETQLERFIAEVGSHRVLFGSDGQVVSPQWSLAKLQAACLNPEDMELILRENAYRVFPKLSRPNSPGCV